MEVDLSEDDLDQKTQQDCIKQMESKDFIMEPAIFACLKR